MWSKLVLLDCWHLTENEACRLRVSDTHFLKLSYTFWYSGWSSSQGADWSASWGAARTGTYQWITKCRVAETERRTDGTRWWEQDAQRTGLSPRESDSTSGISDCSLKRGLWSSSRTCKAEWGKYCHIEASLASLVSCHV